ncbi:HEAT repeat domain-containing protein [Pontiella sulfatireligans]|uniref:HEAT repeat domain-containing protein n=1 Tax=Pontiella sulfatireligans TaxID=2750658 RepID=A0A6C2UM29_9BACT|nr:HEAT repeat domain-containing protein [Pontiella sulfatireligans]VGO20364.1 hypothetical protein SCARR_02427 [Pontiella sulfatireligans]
MNRRIFTVFSVLAAVLMLGLAGCSRTVDDVAKWKASGNVAKLIRALDDLKYEVRLAATEALGELKAEAAVDPLAALFDDDEPDVVLASVNALVSIGNGPASTHLILALKLDNVDARLAAATGLGALKATRSVEDLGMALDDAVAAVALASATSLGQIGEEKGSKPLAGKLSDSSAELRLICVQSLASTGGEEAAKGLVGALDDQDAGVGKAAVESLVAIGDVSIPYALLAIKDNKTVVRKGAIAVLQGLKAVPAKGSDAIWFKLAEVSIDNSDAIDASLVRELAQTGDVQTLLEANAHNVADFREHAFRAVEALGEPCTAQAVEAVGQMAGAQGKSWFDGRTDWNGAPSWRIDLWAAMASLNPAFELDGATVDAMKSQGRNAFRVIISPQFTATHAYTPLLIELLGDQTKPPPEEPDFDAYGMPIVKKARDTFRGEANQETAKDKLIAAGDAGVLPLIAASIGTNELVGGHAAEILGEIGDARAVEPLIGVLTKKIAAGEELSLSPFYNALQKLDAPEAEPVLLKVRPNADRAMRVFERKYPSVNVLSAENRDTSADYTLPTTFRLGYIADAQLVETPVTFAKDGFGDWKPSPPLPAELP